MLATVAALASAVVFGLSTSLQHRVAESVTTPGISGGTFLAQLARRPSWLVGIGLSVFAFLLHVTALGLGALTVVQPIIASGIVFAVLVRAGIDRRLPSWRELGWVAFTWAGLALFMAVVHPIPDQVTPDDVSAALFVMAGVVVAATTVQIANRTLIPERRGVLFGCAAGVLFGLVAGLIKVVIAQAQLGPSHVVFHWSPWAMVAIGLWAMTMNQRAYQVTRLSVSMPVLNIVDAIVAIAFGLVVLSERLASSPTTLVVEIIGLVAMGIGVRQLARREALSTTPIAAPPEQTAFHAMPLTLGVQPRSDLDFPTG